MKTSGITERMLYSGFPHNLINLEHIFKEWKNKIVNSLLGGRGGVKVEWTKLKPLVFKAYIPVSHCDMRHGEA